MLFIGVKLNLVSFTANINVSPISSSEAVIVKDSCWSSVALIIEATFRTGASGVSLTVILITSESITPAVSFTDIFKYTVPTTTSDEFGVHDMLASVLFIGVKLNLVSFTANVNTSPTSTSDAVILNNNSWSS